ncbi:alpha/beta hydrolase [Rhizobium sp. CG5]|uniref:alpha/beta hydrolase n=1 Tax=Rhizobium sp. CG5 TaxID=2726076 RepID=UPI0020332969|nr:alpha/beta fold hydrolase [Rhizobium sp. CG5]MCM2475734.1 alpha/beta hydrolase [Rhizobium sp. CG5]
MASFALKVIRLGLTAAGRAVPKATGRLAFELFCRTPSRRPKGEKARLAVEAGQKRLSRAKELPFDMAHGQVMAYRFPGAEPRAKRFLVVHGWGAGALYVSELAENLASTGAEVVVLDLPGHGKSAGRRLNMRMAVDAVIEAQARFGPFDGAVGHSFGGASLLIAHGGVMRGAGQLNVQKLAVIGSPSEMHWLFRDFSNALRLLPAVRRELVQHAETVAGCSLDAFDTVAISQRLRAPLLVVHAEDDKEVAVDHARRYASAGPHVRFHWANGYGHRRIVSAPEVMDGIVAFLKDDAGSAAA